MRRGRCGHLFPSLLNGYNFLPFPSLCAVQGAFKLTKESAVGATGISLGDLWPHLTTTQPIYGTFLEYFWGFDFKMQRLATLDNFFPSLVTLCDPW